MNPWSKTNSFAYNDWALINVCLVAFSDNQRAGAGNKTTRTEMEEITLRCRVNFRVPIQQHINF